MTLTGLKTGKDAILSHASYFTDITSPLIIVCAICIFLTFKKLDIGCNSIINNIAKLTFPVYLLHDNPYFRKLLWKDIVYAEAFYNANILALIFHMAIVIVGLFVVATIIEWCRTRLEKLIFGCDLLHRMMDKINKVYL